MDKKEKKPICKEAELYYLSLAFGDEYGDVPVQITMHVKSCNDCLRQIQLLKDRLSTAEATDSEDNRLSEVQLHILGLHFAYVGKKVGCETSKPFLPSLLEPSFNIRIPTPISVHVDRCESCNRDLADIQAMGLTGKQLKTLNSILDNDFSVQNVDCTVAADSIQQFVNFDFQAIRPEVVKHLCCCKVCQSLVYRHRASAIRNLSQENVTTAFPCESVTFSDVFDYCYPYGFVPCSDQYASFRKPFVNELKQCAKCLQKVQDLHQRVTFIKQRPESGIVTVYEIGETPISEITTKTQNNYSGFPVSVNATKSIGQDSSPGTEQNKSLNKNIGTRIIKVGLKNIVKAAVAAAIILVAFLFLQSTPTATAVTIGQIYDAIQKAVNIHIQQFSSGNPKSLQEKWVSKSLGIYAIKDKNGFIIWDIRNNEKHLELTTQQQPKIAPLSERQSALIQKRVQGSLGIMPFEKAIQVPEDAKWQELNTSAMENISSDTRVYELIWTKLTREKTLMFYKWRGFIEASTNNPIKVEFYVHSSDEDVYELTATYTIEYINESSIRKLTEDKSP